MSDLPPPYPESTGQPEQLNQPQAVQPIDEFGDPIDIPEFKEVPFLNSLFITLIVALIFSEISFVVATVAKIHALDVYYSEFSKADIVDPGQPIPTVRTGKGHWGFRDRRRRVSIVSNAV